MRLLTLAYFLVAYQLNHAQTWLKVWIPDGTPAEASIYLATNQNDWNPGDPFFQLKQQGDGSFGLLLTQTGTYEGKITRGSWEAVEVNSDGSQAGNRSFRVKGKDTLVWQVAHWLDQVEGTSTRSSRVLVLDPAMEMSALGRSRRIWVYLPPAYDEDPNRRFPVLYMHDGQNLFDQAISYNGEWRVDETLDSLAERRELELIVVGIDNGEEHRMQEYTTWDHPRFGVGEGEAYLDFLINELKPRIEKEFRVIPGQAGLMGSSMGGLITHAAAVRHPGEFKRLGILSPSFWYHDSVFTEAQLVIQPQDIENAFFLVGKREGKNMVQNCEKMFQLYQNQGLSTEQVAYRLDSEGIHHESFWGRELASILIWLYAE
ncbi:MAG: alpha/beta hydrolase-fold protein [Bacteroidota bacterium]